jgi:hypothetical protein
VGALESLAGIMFVTKATELSIPETSIANRVDITARYVS